MLAESRAMKNSVTMPQERSSPSLKFTRLSFLTRQRPRQQSRRSMKFLIKSTKMFTTTLLSSLLTQFHGLMVSSKEQESLELSSLRHLRLSSRSELKPLRPAALKQFKGENNLELQLPSSTRKLDSLLLSTDLTSLEGI